MNMRTVGCLLVGFVVVVGCKKDDKDDNDDDNMNMTTTGYWIVGDQSEMIRIDDDGDVDRYPLDHAGDLMDIACKGTSVAWVVGEGGTILSTRDGGDSWQDVHLETQADLHAVAIAESVDAVYVAGANGTVRLTTDDGESWTTIAGSDADFTGVATDGHGLTALLSGADGSVWRTAGGTFERVFAADDEALHAVALSTDGQHGAAVGDVGLIVVTDDGGDTWSREDGRTTRDLHSVQVARDGSSVVAVGQAGVVVALGDAALTPTDWLDPSLSLRDVHMHFDGDGQAVGDAGVVLQTIDGGRTWFPISVDFDGQPVTLRGVDDFLAGHM